MSSLNNFNVNILCSRAASLDIRMGKMKFERIERMAVGCDALPCTPAKQKQFIINNSMP